LKYLLDTCIISELVKPQINEKVIKWLLGKNENDLFLSVLTIGEIYKGISRLPDSKKRRKLQKWVEEDLINRFEGRILDITLEIAIYWGKQQGELEKKGIKIPVIDGLLAASAVIEKLIFVTRNTKDLENSGAKLINPWE